MVHAEIVPELMLEGARSGRLHPDTLAAYVGKADPVARNVRRHDEDEMLVAFRAQALAPRGVARGVGHAPEARATEVGGIGKAQGRRDIGLGSDKIQLAIGDGAVARRDRLRVAEQRLGDLRAIRGNRSPSADIDGRDEHATGLGAGGNISRKGQRDAEQNPASPRNSDQRHGRRFPFFG